MEKNKEYNNPGGRVEAASNICCVNVDCANYVIGDSVCNLKNIVIGPGHRCSGFGKVVKKVLKKKPNAKKPSRKN